MCIDAKRDAAKAMDPNVRLNEAVQRLLEKSDISKDPILKVAQHPKLYDGIIRAGTPIYESRSPIPVIIFSFAGICFIAWGIYDLGPLPAVAALAMSLVMYDLLSGFLHVVFDDPANLYLPIMGQPCLEFQMHHHFPTDIAQRSFKDVLGDMNVLIILMWSLNLIILDVWSNPWARMLGALKMFMGFYGQFSHRSAHQSKEPSSLVKNLRAFGCMIPIEIHRSHHRAPHDKDFCLVGMCNPLINVLFRTTTNRWFWMAGFYTLALFGVAMESYVCQKVASMLS